MTTVAKELPIKVGAVIISNVKENVINHMAPQLGLEFKPKATLVDKVRQMVGYYKRTTPKAKLADCSTCGGVSNITSKSALTAATPNLDRPGRVGRAEWPAPRFEHRRRARRHGKTAP